VLNAVAELDASASRGRLLSYQHYKWSFAWQPNGSFVVAAVVECVWGETLAVSTHVPQ